MVLCPYGPPLSPASFLGCLPSFPQLHQMQCKRLWLSGVASWPEDCTLKAWILPWCVLVAFPQVWGGLSRSAGQAASSGKPILTFSGVMFSKYVPVVRLKNSHFIQGKRQPAPSEAVKGVVILTWIQSVYIFHSVDRLLERCFFLSVYRKHFNSSTAIQPVLVLSLLTCAGAERQHWTTSFSLSWMDPACKKHMPKNKGTPGKLWFVLYQLIAGEANKLIFAGCEFLFVILRGLFPCSEKTGIYKWSLKIPIRIKLVATNAHLYSSKILSEKNDGLSIIL